MKLTLNRKFRCSTYTIGDLSINGNFFCNTIEDTVRELPAVCPNTPDDCSCTCKEIYNHWYNKVYSCVNKYMPLILELVYVHLSHDQSISISKCSNILELSIFSPLSSENNI